MATKYWMLEGGADGEAEEKEKEIEGVSIKPSLSRTHCASLALFIAALLMLSCGVHKYFSSTAQGPELSQMYADTNIPTTLQGPFLPRTVPFDKSLTLGSEDLIASNPRVARQACDMEPEQISVALSAPDAMWVSWITGEAQIGQNIQTLDPSSVASVVVYGTESSKYTDSANGTSEIYNQLYPFEGLDNYTSGIIHHVRVTGLQPGTTYFYRVGDPFLGDMSDEHSFTTMPSSGPANYPARIGVIGDIGLTYNSTSTFDHLTMNQPDLVLMVGDLSYADLYVTNGTGAASYSQAFPDTPIHETYQPRWDLWGRFMQPLTSRVPFMVIEGNHEKEPQVDQKTFAAYQARFAVPYRESGAPNSLYYSFNAGGIHFLMLGAYIDYSRSSEQYAWLEQDLAKVNRRVTPWLIAVWHPPWYNSYIAHYREVECMRISMESLLYENGVDLVLNGHIHAYERINRIFNYTLDNCGPVHITVGDGGNHEKIAQKHADDAPELCPNPSDTADYCGFNFDNGPAAGHFCWSQQPEWSAYREASFGHGIIETRIHRRYLEVVKRDKDVAGKCTGFSRIRYISPNTSLEFDEGPLTPFFSVINSTHLVWTWHRNQDMFNGVGDQLYIVRQPGICPNQPFV